MPLPQNCPASATNNLINALGVLAFIASLWICYILKLSPTNSALISAASYAFTIILLEIFFLRTPWRDSVELDFSVDNFSLSRCIIKFLGVLGSFGFCGFIYWLLKEYHRNYFTPYWSILSSILPVLLFFIPCYIVFSAK